MAHQEQEICYVCRQCANDENPFMDPNPCNCKGSIKLHQSCYKELENTTENCGICTKEWCKHGAYTLYHPNGKKWKEATYVNGLLHGLYHEWFINGQKSIEANYINGLLHGLYRKWTGSGKKSIEANYTNGLLDGLHTTFYSNNKYIKIN